MRRPAFSTRLRSNPFKPTGIDESTVAVSHVRHGRVAGDRVSFSTVRQGDNGLIFTRANVGPPYTIQEPVMTDTYTVTVIGRATDTKAFGGGVIIAHYAAAQRKEMEP